MSERLRIRPGLNRAVRVLVGVAAALLLLVLLGYAAFPWLTSALAPRLATALELDGVELAAERPGLTAMRLNSAVVTRGRIRLLLEDVRITYTPSSLWAGRLGTVQVGYLEAVVHPPAESPAPAGNGVAADPQALLEAVPASRVSVDSLALRVPEVDFAATGSAVLERSALKVHLTARAPEQAAGLALDAGLTGSGSVTARLAAGDAPPFVEISSRLPAGGDRRLALDGKLRLRGFAFELARSLAGLPPADGEVAGELSASLPWPLAQSADWTAAAGEGEVALTWRPHDGAWAADAVAVTAQLAGGVLQARAEGPLMLAGDGFHGRATLSDWRLPDGGGTARLRIAPAAGREPVLDLDLRVRDARLAVGGSLEIRDRLLALARERLPLPAGDGRLRLTFESALDWPPPWPPPVEALAASGTVAGAWTPSDPEITLPALDGRWQLEAQRLSGRLDATVAYHGLEADLGVSLEGAALLEPTWRATGAVRLGRVGRVPFEVIRQEDGFDVGVDASLEIDTALAGKVVDDWGARPDLSGGTLGIDGELRWREQLDGSLDLRLENVNAHFGEYAVTGLSGRPALTVDDGAWRLRPSALNARRIDTGVVLRDVSTGLAWSGDTVSAHTTRLALLGGHGHVDAFDYAIGRGSARMLIELTGLDLAQILALEGEHVSGTGTIDATLPVSLDDNRPRIDGGSAHADDPGGVLRVSEALAGGTGQPGLDFALRALQNFRYSVLEAGVDYAPSGDLTLAVHLEGRNPEIEQGRPIHYNVTVNENLPVLLKSLRLEREVTRSIERRLSN